MPRKLIDARRRKKGEADLYSTPQGRRQTAQEFARALKSGTLSRSAGLKIRKTDPKRFEQLTQLETDQVRVSIKVRGHALSRDIVEARRNARY